MKHIRFVIMFFQILLFAVITGTNAQAAYNCKTTQKNEYTTELSGWTCLANGDPSYTKQKTTVTSCATCNSGYELAVGGTIKYYVCDMSACYGSSLDNSGCQLYTDIWYNCVATSSGGDSGDDSGTTTGPCANYTVANWNSAWTDVSSTENKISISYESSKGCNFRITDSNLIKDSTGTFRAVGTSFDSIYCYEK
jgi:hypothetical protein